MMRVAMVVALSLLSPLALAQSMSGASLQGGSVSAPSGGGAFACNDLIDNDGDGITDYPGDAGCDSIFDTDESGDKLVIVYGNVSAADINTCIGGSDATNCNNIGGGGTRVTVCSGSTSAACSGSATRWSVSGSWDIPQTHVSLNRLGKLPAIYEGDDYLAFVDGFAQGGVFGDGTDFVRIYNSTLDGDADDTGCADDANSAFGCRCGGGDQCTDRLAQGWEIVGNTFRDFYGIGTAPEDGHSEALFIGRGSDGAFVTGNTFTYNGTTSHVFLTYFTGAGCDTDDMVGACVTENIWGPRGTAYPGTGCDHAPADSDAKFSTGNSPDGFVSTDRDRISESTGSHVDCDLGGTCIGACMECNDGIDQDPNDGDGGLYDYKGGFGDPDCTYWDDNDEDTTGYQ